jgi:hypothetical protein
LQQADLLLKELETAHTAVDHTAGEVELMVVGGM